MPRVPRIRPGAPQEPKQRVQPVQARARKKIDAILDATNTLLERHGVEAVTTTAIAEAAGVPPATVYHYFENRLAIFAALARRTTESVDTALIPLIEAQMATGKPDIRALLEGLFDAYAAQPGYVSVMAALRAEPTLQQVARESNERGAAAIAAMLSKVGKLPPKRAARVAWIVSETCDTVLQAALVAERREARALIDEAVTVVECLFAYYSRIGRR